MPDGSMMRVRVQRGKTLSNEEKEALIEFAELLSKRADELDGVKAPQDRRIRRPQRKIKKIQR